MLISRYKHDSSWTCNNGGLKKKEMNGFAFGFGTWLDRKKFGVRIAGRGKRNGSFSSHKGRVGGILVMERVWRLESVWGIVWRRLQIFITLRVKPLGQRLKQI